MGQGVRREMSWRFSPNRRTGRGGGCGARGGVVLGVRESGGRARRGPFLPGERGLGVRLFGGGVRAGWQGGGTTDRSEGARTMARNSAFSDSEPEGRGVPGGMTASV